MPRRKKQPTLSKASAIRDYKSTNPNAKPKEIAESLAKEGYEMTPQYVSMILSNDRRKSGSTKSRSSGAGNTSFGRRGRPPKSRGTVSVDDVLVAKQFVGEMGSVEAAQAAVSAFAKLSGALK